jgi:hypothetical protein
MNGEMTPDHPDADTEAMGNAVRDVMAAILLVAIRHRVCPVCLTYVTAEAVEDGEEKGMLKHGIPSEDLETMPTEGGMQ